VAVEDGTRAWSALQEPDAPCLVLLDSVMPGESGPELCRRLRAEGPERPRHVVLLTSRSAPADLEQGLEAGADDYICKPFRESELRARLRAGQRAVGLQMRMADHAAELQAALDRIRQLEGVLPICSYCRKIRDGESDWQSLERFLSSRSRAQFSHDICPSCYESVVEPELEAFRDSMHRGDGQKSA
jgi:CheY-like chemotaxis protein